MDLNTLITQLTDVNSKLEHKIYGTKTEIIGLHHVKDKIEFLLLDEKDDLIQGNIDKKTKTIKITSGKFLNIGLSEEAIIKELSVRLLKYKTIKMKV